MKLTNLNLLEKCKWLNFDFDIYIHYGSGAYICGEETALIESLEGKKGQPRLNHHFQQALAFMVCPLQLIMLRQ